MRANEKEKEELIDNILANPVYMPWSRLVIDLRVALKQLSRRHLMGLKTIIAMKGKE